MAKSPTGSTRKSTRTTTRTSRGSKRGNFQATSSIGTWWAHVSPERRIDLLGGGLVLVGSLSLFSLLARYEAGAAQWWIAALRLVGGEGAFLLPLFLALFGAWLILRRIEKLSIPSWERVVGCVLLYLNILTWLHLLRGGGWDIAEACGLPGRACLGGGYLGGVFERLLNGSLGKVGAVIVLIIWSVLAVIITFNLSLPAIARGTGEQTRKALGWWDSRYGGWMARRRYEQRAAEIERMEAARAAVTGAVADDFIPLPGREGEAVPAAPQPRRANRGGTAAETTGRETRAGQAREAGQPAVVTQGPEWQLPNIADILDPPTADAIASNVDQDRARVIEDTLASFGAPVHVVDISRGPTLTQFGVEPDYIETRTGRTRVRVNKIVSLADDLALALAAKRIRIQAPVPGSSFVGIEVPNSVVSRVMLREVIESDGFQKLRSPVRMAIGKDVSGKAVSYDLASMPHLLIAGTTGSGKSVCVNAILSSFLLHNSPRDLRMVLVDPKRVELTGYNGIPHLITPVITDAEKVLGVLQWVLREMDGRYARFVQVGARNIQEYNRKQQPTLPYLLVLVDELADLMLLAAEEVERSLTRLAQLARATGIHLVLATQRPSVDVLTGQIKANFPARIAFAVPSQIDSRVILDQPGAERLLGKGDMLFQAPDAVAPVRLQGVWVGESEILRLIDFWRTQEYMLRQNPGRVAGEAGAVTAEPVNMDLALSTPLKQSTLFDGEMGSKEGDPLFEEAVRIVRTDNKASISMLQRKMRIGYTRAARLIDALESKGIIGPALATSQVREVISEAEKAEEPVEEE